MANTADPFDVWKLALLNSAGSAAPAVLRRGEALLKLYWKAGCEPTIDGLLHYADRGLLYDSESWAARGMLTPVSPARPQP
jgi:hypothetical protein